MNSFRGMRKTICGRSTGCVQCRLEELLTPVDFFYGAFTLPVVFYLGFVNNHSVHHRGQLATYLRPMGSQNAASIYGGSFDEPWAGSSGGEQRRLIVFSESPEAAPAGRLSYCPAQSSCTWVSVEHSVGSDERHALHLSLRGISRRLSKGSR